MVSNASADVASAPVGRGKGKGGMKRNAHTRLFDTNQGLTKPAVRRLARRGGVKRVGGGIYAETRKTLRAFLQQVIHDAVIYTEYGKRKTVTSTDVIYSLKNNGHTMYGF